jgi:prepilin-type N-terminal cleavage/methylation domain-containing protein/prepilin-type processing-associated H-X9-DG protein
MERHRRGIVCNGFTLIELLVSVGIIGLLVALLLPAVQQAREASRRAACGNNFRQIALALQNYQSTHSVYPSASGMPDYTVNEKESLITNIRAKNFSAYTQMLPQLEQGPLYARLNFEVEMDDLYRYPKPAVILGPNRTAMSATLAVFLCPSDAPGGDPGWTGGCNYRVNLGADRWNTVVESPTDGPLMSFRCTTPASISDGLSNTVAFGEKLRGRVSDPVANPRTDMFNGGLGAPYTADESLNACLAGFDPARFFTAAGLTWSVGDPSQTCYNHVVGPNSTMPDCCLFGGDPIAGIVGARSNHPGGVQAAMADGSARFFKTSIDRRVWRAVGTRAGGEIVPADGL